MREKKDEIDRERDIEKRKMREREKNEKKEKKFVPIRKTTTTTTTTTTTKEETGEVTHRTFSSCSSRSSRTPCLDLLDDDIARACTSSGGACQRLADEMVYDSQHIR